MPVPLGFVANPLGVNQHSRVSPRTVKIDLSTIDGRSKQALTIKKTVRDLAEQLGRDPTPAEYLVLERIGVLMGHLRKLDMLAAAGKARKTDARVINQWTRTIAALVDQLGLKPPRDYRSRASRQAAAEREKAPSLAEYLERKARAQEAAQGPPAPPATILPPADTTPASVPAWRLGDPLSMVMLKQGEETAL